MSLKNSSKSNVMTRTALLDFTKKILLCKGSIFLFFLVLSIFHTAQAQDHANCYRIYLTDKNDSPFSINNPLDYLSERAIEKRNRYNIPVTEEDLPVNPSYIRSVSSLSGDIQILSYSKWMNTIVIYCPDPLVMDDITALPFVREILPVANYTGPENSHNISISNAGQAQTFLNTGNIYDYGMADMQISVHNGQYLHREGYAGNGMLIAVLDAGWNGFDTLSYFRNLYENGQIAGTRDLIPWSDNVYSGHPHGTAVTSVMASSVDGTLVGTAPEAHYFFIRTENPYSEQLIEEDFWVRGAETADSIGADVINSSLGYTNFPDFPQSVWTYAQCDGMSSIASLAAAKATEKGIIVCVSAGNTGDQEWHYIVRPADAFHILTVGGINPEREYAVFSSTGPTYDRRVKPDVTAIGQSTAIIWDDGTLSYGNGTSLSCPVISGLAACLWQALPEKSAQEIMQIVRESSHQYHLPDSLMGYGIPDFYQAYLTYKEPSSIYSYSDRKQITVHPNPCRNVVMIPNAGLNIKQVEIYDMNGKSILKSIPAATAIITMNITDMKPGFYIGRIEINDREYRWFKMIKAE